MGEPLPGALHGDEIQKDSNVTVSSFLQRCHMFFWELGVPEVGELLSGPQYPLQIFHDQTCLVINHGTQIRPHC